MRNLFLFPFILLLLAIPIHAVDFSVGVSPPIVEVGDVSPGEIKIVKFNILTSSDENLLVFFDITDTDIEFFGNRFKHVQRYVSEEKSESWLEPIQDPVEIDTAEKTSGRSWTEVAMVLTVPEDAEPGYHVIQVEPIPTFFGPGGATGANVVAVIAVSIIFNVEGDALRDGVILDSTAEPSSGNQIKLNTHFKNTGTVTLKSRSVSNLYDNGNLIGEYKSIWTDVEPDELKVFNVPVSGEFFGDYDISSLVEFTTGQASLDTTINIQGLVIPTITEEPEKGFDMLPVILLIIVIIVLFVIYRWLRER